MEQCEICREEGIMDCKHCYLGNPCIGCTDYDEQNDKCKSNGGCGKVTAEEAAKNFSKAVASFSENIENLCKNLPEAILNICKPLVDYFVNNLEPYAQQELLHPRKKPRGSIRRYKKWKRNKR